MPIASFIFNETSPATAGTAASSNAVTGAASWLPAGVAGPLDDYEGVDIVAELQGATGGTLDVYVQLCPDGQNWYDVIHFAQQAAAGSLNIYQATLSLATTTTAPIAVGKNLSPALAASTVVNGAWTDRLRLVMKAGASTSAGAPVVVRVTPQRSRVRESGGS